MRSIEDLLKASKKNSLIATLSFQNIDQYEWLIELNISGT
jgi:hypothetical protein